MKISALKNKLTEDIMLNKEDVVLVLRSLEAYYRILMKDSSDSNFYEKLVAELVKFADKVHSSDFPEYIAAPWCYYVDINLKFFEVGLGVVNVLELDDNRENPKIYTKTFPEKIEDNKQYVLNFFEKYSLLKYTVPKLSVEEFAQQNNLSPISIRQYIREGLIKGAEKQGRDWAIPLLASINRVKYENATYDVIGDIKDIPIKYKYLETENVAYISLMWSGNSRKECEVTLSCKTEMVSCVEEQNKCIKMTKKEMKEFEKFLISNKSFEYHEPISLSLCTFWMKSHITKPAEVSKKYFYELTYHCGMFYLDKPLKYFESPRWDLQMYDLLVLMDKAIEAD